MTVIAENPEVILSFDPNESVYRFDFSMNAQDQSKIKVFLSKKGYIPSLDDEFVLLILGTDYTVVFEPANQGGYISLVDASSEAFKDYKYTIIIRAESYEQPQPYPQFYDREVSEHVTDNLERQVQQVAAAVKNVEDLIEGEKPTIEDPSGKGRVVAIEDAEKLIFKGTDLQQTEEEGMKMTSNLTLPSMTLNDVRISASGDIPFVFDLDDSEDEHLLQIKNRKIIATNTLFPDPSGYPDGHGMIVEAEKWAVKLPRDDIPTTETGQNTQALIIQDGKARWADNRPEIPKPNQGAPGKVLAVNSTQTEYTFADNSGGGGGSGKRTYLVGDKVDTMNPSYFIKEGKFLRLKDSGQKVIPLKGQIIDLEDYPDYKKFLDLDTNNIRWTKTESVPNSIVAIDFAALDLKNGVAVSSKGTYYLTEDAGKTFTEYSIENSFVFTCCAVSPDEKVTVLAGVNGKFMISFDKYSFFRYQLDSGLNINACCFGDSSSTLIFVCDHGKIETIIHRDWANPVQFDSGYDEKINFVKFRSSDNTAIAVGNRGFILESSSKVSFVSWLVKNPPGAGKQGTFLTPFESIFLKDGIKLANSAHEQDQILLGDDGVNTFYSSTSDGITFNTAVDDAVYDFKAVSPTSEASFLATQVVADKARIIDIKYNSTAKDSIGLEFPVTENSTFSASTSATGYSTLTVDKAIVIFNKKLKTAELTAPLPVLSVSEDKMNLSIVAQGVAPETLNIGQKIENIYTTDDYVLLETIPLDNGDIFCIANSKESSYNPVEIDNWQELVKSFVSGEYVFFAVNSAGDIIQNSLYATQIYRNKLHNTTALGYDYSSTFFKTAVKDKYIFIWMPIARENSNLMDFENNHFSMFMIDTETYEIKHNFYTGGFYGMGFPPLLMSLDIFIEKNDNNTYYIGVWGTTLTKYGSSIYSLNGITFGNFRNVYPELQVTCPYASGRPPSNYPDKYQNRKALSKFMSPIKLVAQAFQHTVLKKEEDDEGGVIVGYGGITNFQANSDYVSSSVYGAIRGTKKEQDLTCTFAEVFIYKDKKVSEISDASATVTAHRIYIKNNIPAVDDDRNTNGFLIAMMVAGIADIKVVRSKTTQFIIIVPICQHNYSRSASSDIYIRPIGGFLFAEWTQAQQDSNTIPTDYTYSPSLDAMQMYSSADNFGHCSSTVDGLESASGVQMPWSWLVPKGINLIRQTDNKNEFYIVGTRGAPIGDPQVAYHPQFSGSAPLTHENTSEGRVAALEEYDYSQYTYMTSTNTTAEYFHPHTYVAKIVFTPDGKSIEVYDIATSPLDSSKKINVYSQFFSIDQLSLNYHDPGFNLLYLRIGLRYNTSFAYDANFANLPLEMIHITKKGIICSACEVIPQEVALKGIPNSPTNHTTIALKKVFNAIHLIPNTTGVAQQLPYGITLGGFQPSSSKKYYLKPTSSYAELAGYKFGNLGRDPSDKTIVYPPAPRSLKNATMEKVEAASPNHKLKTSCKFFDDIVLIYYSSSTIINPIIAKRDGVWQPIVLEGYEIKSDLNSCAVFRDHLFICTQGKDVLMLDRNYKVVKVYTKDDTLLARSPIELDSSGSDVLLIASSSELSALSEAGDFTSIDVSVMGNNYIKQTYINDDIYIFTTEHYDSTTPEFYYIWDVKDDLTLQKCEFDFKEYYYNGNEINFQNGCMTTGSQYRMLTVNYATRKDDRVHIFGTVNARIDTSYYKPDDDTKSSLVFTFHASFTQGQKIIDVDLGDGWNACSYLDLQFRPTWHNPHVFQMENTMFSDCGTFLEVGDYLIGGSYFRDDFYLDSFGESPYIGSMTPRLDLKAFLKTDLLYSSPKRNVVIGTVRHEDSSSIPNPDDCKNLYQQTPGENITSRWNCDSEQQHFFTADRRNPRALPQTLHTVDLQPSTSSGLKPYQNYALTEIDKNHISLVCRISDEKHTAGSDMVVEYIITLPVEKEEILDAYYKNATSQDFTQMPTLHEYLRSGTTTTTAGDIYHLFITKEALIFNQEKSVFTPLARNTKLKEAYNFLFFRNGTGVFILAKASNDDYYIFTSFNNKFEEFVQTPIDVPEGCEILNSYLNVMPTEEKDPTLLFIQTTQGVYVASITEGVPDANLNFISYSDDYTFVVGEDATVLRKANTNYFTMQNSGGAPNLKLVDSDEVGNLLVAGEDSYKSTNQGETFEAWDTVDGDKTYIYSDGNAGKSFLVSDGSLYVSQANWTDYKQVSANNRGSINKSSLVYFEGEYTAFFGGSDGVWLETNYEAEIKPIEGSYPADSDFAGFIFTSPELGILLNVFVFSSATGTTTLFSLNKNETADPLATYNFKTFSSAYSIKDNKFYLGCESQIRFGEDFATTITVGSGNITSLVLGAADSRHVYAGDNAGSLYFCEEVVSSSSTFVKQVLPPEVGASDVFISETSSVILNDVTKFSSMLSLGVDEVIAWVLEGALNTSKLLMRNADKSYSVKDDFPQRIKCVRIQDRPSTIIFVAGGDDKAYLAYSLDFINWIELSIPISLEPINTFEVANNLVTGVDALGQAFKCEVYLDTAEYRVADSIIHGKENLEFLVAEESAESLLAWEDFARFNGYTDIVASKESLYLFGVNIDEIQSIDIYDNIAPVASPLPGVEITSMGGKTDTLVGFENGKITKITGEEVFANGGNRVIHLEEYASSIFWSNSTGKLFKDGVEEPTAFVKSSVVSGIFANDDTLVVMGDQSEISVKLGTGEMQVVYSDDLGLTLKSACITDENILVVVGNQGSVITVDLDTLISKRVDIRSSLNLIGITNLGNALFLMDEDCNVISSTNYFASYKIEVFDLSAAASIPVGIKTNGDTVYASANTSSLKTIVIKGKYA